MSQAWSEFDRAVHRLASPGTQHARLCSACSPTLVNLRKKELPAESQADFERLTQTLGASGGRADSQRVAAAIAALSEPQVEDLLALLMRIHQALSLYQPRTAPPGP